MNFRRFRYGIAILLLFTYDLYGQEFTQVIRGKVVDTETQFPLPFASIAVITLDPTIGVTSDEEGNFRLEKVPVGRHDLQVSYLGYEAKVVPELLVTSGKEIVLNIGLKQSVTKLDEVSVKAYAKKDKPLNSMATVSARTFSVEEATRYAGGFDDPARLAASFAGVSTGHLDDNGITIRGNAPKGLLWRLEGVEIPNPNHFAGLTSFGGGGVSALSSLLLANSDFFTGAFPAEYGNALSGVFDIKLRNGNNENYEHAVQLGVLGLDISSEGPFSKKSNASYLFNYRYSTFGLIKPILPEDTNVPIYQDLCFKINVPTENAGIFSLWALAADDKIEFDAEADTAKWKYIEDQETGKSKLRMGAAGLNHRYIFGPKTYLNSSFVYAGDQIDYDLGVLDFEMNNYPTEHIQNTNYRFTLASTLTHKFGAKHTNRTGIIVNNLNYNTLLKFAPEYGDDLITTADERGSSDFFEVFSQSKLNLTHRFIVNLGLHTQYFDLSKEFTLEPRLGLTYNLTNIQSLSFAYGLHSRLEPQGLYFANVSEGNTLTQANKDLNITKAHHFVLAYDISLSRYLRLKIEPFAQFLYDVPVIPDSNYSTINIEAEWYFTDKFENTGTATNFGIDVTLERFLNKGYYYLFTASLFESKYVGGDERERMSRYNSNYVFNLLFGKEWILGASKNKILGVNLRLNIMGGQRITPVDEELSHQYGYIIYDNSRAFEDQKPPVYYLNASITWRSNKKNHSGIWTLQVLNMLGVEDFYGYDYNYRTNTIEEDAVIVIVPSISYKIEF